MANNDDNDPPVTEPNVISLEDAQREMRRKRRRRSDPPPAQARNGAAPGKWTPNEFGLPIEDSSPVEPIGFEGSTYYVIDASQQFRAVTAKDFNQAGIQDLFSPYSNYPKWAWPRYGRATVKAPPPIKSFEADGVKETLFAACKFKGIFSPSDNLRGRGCWSLRDGQLIYHAGDAVWVHDPQHGFRELPTGLYGDHLYPRMAPLPSPLVKPITLEDCRRTLGALLQTLRTWKWERPAIDPVLLLGWIGVAFLGGALSWRSAMLLLGDAGTGKSTLQELLQILFGPLLFHSADTTAAAIYQSLRFDSRPVALDELEPGADPRKVQNVVQLMRDASSGAMGRRGSSGGIAAEFQMRSAFLFSAINNPIQSSQDLSRIAILRLRPLDLQSHRPPPINDACGRLALTRMMMEWPKFAALRQVYGEALGAGHHGGRGQDTYGTLLACAELMLGPELGAELGVPLSEAPEYWTEALAAENLAEVEDAMTNWYACAHHLLTSQVLQWRSGSRTTVGQLVEELRTNSDNVNIHHARKELALTGLYIFMPGEVASYEQGYVLAVPNASQLVAQLYQETPWQAAQMGAGGPWKDALRQAPPEVVLPGNHPRIRIAGIQHRCTLLVLRHFSEAST